MTEHSLSLGQPDLPKSTLSLPLSSPWMLGCMVLSATMLLGFGWLLFPLDVQMVWTMLAQAILFSLAISVLVVDVMRLWKTKAFMPRRHVLVFVPVWVAIGLINLRNAYDCMRAAGQW
ncbi:hypothetical protein [Gluconobacter thailandicus]|uniref:Uncharacterized protein n=1 Tax=Gluconobacter thailandicus TaxID=257438 RepID=A0AAP9EUW4_GLUTH|nr:hypothetical protein [Gluconobacter thailandicus]QEH97853.1 hypothetical protein FXF46_16315 [Gluconobacter thailandicus]